MREAAAADDLVALRAGLASKPSTEALTDALVAAAGRGKLAAARELLAAGASPASASSEKGGIRPLLLASYGGHTAVVQELLAQKASADAENADRPVLLRQLGVLERVSDLLRGGLDPDDIDELGLGGIGGGHDSGPFLLQPVHDLDVEPAEIGICRH